MHVDGPGIGHIRSDYPFLRLVFIPSGTYPTQKDPIRTIGVENILVCRADLAEDIVYELTRGLFDMVSGLAAERTSLRLMNIEQAPATPIPLHPGAARYYREREIAR